VEMKITLTYNVEVKINGVKIFVVMGFRLGIYTNSFIYLILSSIVRTFFKENYDEILPAHYTWEVPGLRFKITWLMP
jgi:hypothetical protein